MHQRSNYKYDVVLTFAGEDREYVESVVNELHGHDISVFYDHNEQSFLWGKDLQPTFGEIYRAYAQYCMVFISKHYPKKAWARMELKFAKDRATKDEMKEYILPIRLDDTTIPEIADTIGYIPGTTPPEKVAELFVEKLNAPGFARTSPRKRVFVSYCHESDEQLKDFIIGQSKNSDSPFEVAAYSSMEEIAPGQNWEAEAESRIKRSDLVLVMVGPQTHKAPGVLKEVEMARRNNIRIVQVIGYKDGNYTAVPNAGRLYSWNWDNLQKLL